MNLLFFCREFPLKKLWRSLLIKLFLLRFNHNSIHNNAPVPNRNCRMATLFPNVWSPLRFVLFQTADLYTGRYWSTRDEVTFQWTELSSWRSSVLGRAAARPEDWDGLAGRTGRLLMDLRGKPGRTPPTNL